jgi:hypothetical protein
MRQFGSDLLGKRWTLAAIAACAIGVGAGPTAALAGEVKGPPGTPEVLGSGSETDTGAPAHANSICAFSGLNDFRAENGQIEVITQSPGTEHRLGYTPAGIPGKACKGFSNPENPREKP